MKSIKARNNSDSAIHRVNSWIYSVQTEETNNVNKCSKVISLNIILFSILVYISRFSFLKK